MKRQFIYEPQPANANKMQKIEENNHKLFLYNGVRGTLKFFDHAQAYNKHTNIGYDEWVVINLTPGNRYVLIVNNTPVARLHYDETCQIHFFNNGTIPCSLKEGLNLQTFDINDFTRWSIEVN